MAMFEQINEMAKDYLKQRLKKQVLNNVGSHVASHIAGFWWVYLIILAVFIFFYLIAALISSNQTIASTAFVSERFLPPQIYVPNLEKTITSEYGERIHPITRKKTFHDGVDIALPIGTPVSSSTDGIVKTVFYPSKSDNEETQSTGIYVAVESTDPVLGGMVTRYLHLDNAYVIPGQTVKKGQIIGLSGNTGRSTGPHLHYGMVPEGEEAIDPIPFVSIISQVVDVAAEAAFDTLRDDVNWTTMYGFDYQTDPQLYISNLYLESAAPTFKEQGTVYTRQLNGGAIVGQGSGGSYGPTPVVHVPTEFGVLNHPFFLKWAEYAMESEERTGIKASVTLAQMALESAWGKIDICNNVFGIKADRSWTGPSCSSGTTEQTGGSSYHTVANFRAYSSYKESFDDHARFLLVNNRYRTALSKDNPFEMANELQKAGYATDWQYANKLKSIMMQYNLPSLDLDRGIDQSTGERWRDIPLQVVISPTPTPPINTAPPTSTPSLGENTSESIVVVFGIQQAYGTYARQVHRTQVTRPKPKPSPTPTPSSRTTVGSSGGQSTTDDDEEDDKETYVEVSYTNLIDPYTKKPIINLVNYNNVLHLYSGETESPSILIKDVPDAIAVTLESEADEVIVRRIDFVKGQY